MTRRLVEFRWPISSIPFNRCMSSKGFIQSLIEKVKEESNRDTDLKENIKKFREETAKLEQSKEIQTMRDFYKKIEKELPTDTVEKLMEKLQSVKVKLKEEGQQIAMNESIKKNLESLAKASEQFKGVTKSISDTEILKAAMKGIEAVEQELQSDRAKMYQPPEILKTRSEIIGKTERMIQADSESSGVVLHKDSRWYVAWQDFKDNNQYVQKYFDLRAQYEESDHFVVRSMRFVTDRVSSLFGGMSSSNELQQVMDEITKTDPSFDMESFVRFCRFVVIPNVLEPFNVLATPLKQIQELGLRSESRVLDINNLDVSMGKMMEQGPVLIITFQAQQINCIRDRTGSVREGDPHKVFRVTHVWALCRDQSELQPWTAWRILDVAMMPTEQWM